MSLQFRTDINGLRAVAVIAVVLFHFGVPGMAGGFLGVDVFFVISGLLMTGIIDRKLSEGNFRLLDFYGDRVRRILPALIALCCLSLLTGAVALMPADFKQLGKHVASAPLFLSNVVFNSESGYFDQGSHEKWMLHTWSLSVEWQFYLLYPVALMLSARWPRAVKRWAMAAAMLGSLALAIRNAAVAPSDGFFLLPSRGWELLMGAVVYHSPWRFTGASRRALEVAGLIAVIAACSLAPPDAALGFAARVVAVLGTAAMLAAQCPAPLLTGSFVAQYLGTISYSLYLWHWPVAVALGFYTGETGLAATIVGIALAVLLAAGSQRALEVLPQRLATRFGKGRFAIVALCAALAVAVTGAGVYGLKGLPGRERAPQRTLDEQLVMPTIANGWCFYSVDSIPSLAPGEDVLKCRLGARSSARRLLLFGDSFAGHYEPLWDMVAGNAGLEVTSLTTNWCVPALGSSMPPASSARARAQCDWNRRYFERSAGAYDIIVFSGWWTGVVDRGELGGVQAALALAARSAKRVIVMPAPRTFDTNVTLRYQRRRFLGLPFHISNFPAERDVATRAANAAIANLVRAYSNVVMLDRADLFTVDGQLADVTSEGVPFSLDGAHLSVYGSLAAGRVLLQSASVLRGVLGREQQPPWHE